MKPRHLALLASLSFFNSIFGFIKHQHWGYIPPMIILTLFMIYCMYYDWKREKAFASSKQGDKGE